MNRLKLEFHRVEGGLYELGWLPDSLPDYSPPLDWLRQVSPRRRVRLAAFEIAKTPVRFDSLFDPYDDTALEEAYLRPVRLVT